MSAIAAGPTLQCRPPAARGWLPSNYVPSQSPWQSAWCRSHCQHAMLRSSSGLLFVALAIADADSLPRQKLYDTKQYKMALKLIKQLLATHPKHGGAHCDIPAGPQPAQRPWR